MSGCTDSDASYEAGEELPGGATTNTLLLGTNAFTTPVRNITEDHEPLFFAGNGFFNQPWVEAPSSTASRDGLGPLFNARSCAACHFKDGRGRPPLESSEPFLGLLLRLSVSGTGQEGAPIPEPTYGGQLQPFSIQGVPAEGRPIVTTTEVDGEFDDGEPFSLAVPQYDILDLAHGPLAPTAELSPRVAPAMIGLGLLQAIPLDRLRSLADPDDDDGDGISGRLNHVWSEEKKTITIGRFGWKAEQPTVRQQAAGAFLGDIGITTSLFSAQTCTETQDACKQAIPGGSPELSDALLHRVDVYSRLLAVPVRVQYNSEDVLRGKTLFRDLGCAGCHTPSHQTGPSDLRELSDQTIWPYTDLLLHDMGAALSDNRPSFSASGNEWRTPPLWGLRLFETVNQHNRLLHDGRARGVVEAILWHGGEGKDSQQAFVSLSANDRALLVAFVESL